MTVPCAQFPPFSAVIINKHEEQLCPSRPPQGRLSSKRHWCGAMVTSLNEFPSDDLTPPRVTRFSLLSLSLTVNHNF